MNVKIIEAIEAATEHLPSFMYGNGRFEIRDKITTTDEAVGLTAPGVWFIERNSEGIDGVPKFVCSWLTVRALTRSAGHDNWGRLLAWRDSDRRLHEWSCPMGLFSGDGTAVREQLLKGGLAVDPAYRTKNLLAAYIQNFPTDKRAQCVERLGWLGNRYVLPDKTIGGGESDEIVVFQNPQALKPAFSTSGTVDEWRANVAALAVGNDQLMFVLSTGFTGALLNSVGMEGGGFHLCGDSSQGKTVMQRAAASIWGNPGQFLHSWRITSNALEGTALLHNDGILILNEIKEVSTKEAGAIVYMLANGQAKGRANRAGMARKTPTWKTIVLSSGEVGLAEMMRQAGERAYAGQEIRLAELPAGGFTNLHGQAESRQFAEALEHNSMQYYGAVGVEFLQELVKVRAEKTPLIQRSIETFISEVVPKGGSAQASRVAKRFALVAVAGEMATGFGLTGWAPGAAIVSAKHEFKSWLDHFGSGDREATEILSQVKAFFEAHGASRFGKLTDSDEKIVNRAGCFSDDGAGRIFYVLPEIFKNELCKGLNAKTATKTLIGARWIKPGMGRATQSVRIPAMGGPTRVYVFTGSMWEDDNELQ